MTKPTAHLSPGSEDNEQNSVGDHDDIQQRLDKLSARVTSLESQHHPVQHPNNLPHTAAQLRTHAQIFDHVGTLRIDVWPDGQRTVQLGGIYDGHGRREGNRSPPHEQQALPHNADTQSRQAPDSLPTGAATAARSDSAAPSLNEQWPGISLRAQTPRPCTTGADTSSGVSLPTANSLRQLPGGVSVSNEATQPRDTNAGDLDTQRNLTEGSHTSANAGGPHGEPPKNDRNAHDRLETDDEALYATGEGATSSSVMAKPRESAPTAAPTRRATMVLTDSRKPRQSSVAPKPPAASRATKGQTPGKPGWEEEVSPEYDIMDEPMARGVAQAKAGNGSGRPNTRSRHEPLLLPIQNQHMPPPPPPPPPPPSRGRNKSIPSTINEDPDEDLDIPARPPRKTKSKAKTKLTPKLAATPPSFPGFQTQTSNQSGRATPSRSASIHPRPPGLKLPREEDEEEGRDWYEEDFTRGSFASQASGEMEGIGDMGRGVEAKKKKRTKSVSFVEETDEMEAEHELTQPQGGAEAGRRKRKSRSDEDKDGGDEEGDGDGSGRDNDMDIRHDDNDGEDDDVDGQDDEGNGGSPIKKARTS